MPKRPPSSDDRHTVLFLPGFLATDHSNAPLASVAKANGCRPARSYLTRNEGPTPAIIDHLNRRIQDLAAERGRLSLVGVSLGGVYARMLARRYPELVRQVITIGSPIRMEADRHNSRLVKRLWQAREAAFDPEALERFTQAEEAKSPLTMPATSIFSRMDGVVAWPRSLVAEREQSENIEVRYASHVGLIVHPGTHLVLADRLRQDPDHWRPYTVSGRSRGLVRRAEYFDPSRAQ